MARGKKHPTEIKEKAIAALAVNGSPKAVAEQMDLPKTTVEAWAKKAETDQEFVQLRAKKKEEFVRNAWRTIEDAMKLGARRVKRALEHEAELDLIIDAIEDQDMNEKTKQALVHKVQTLQLQGIKDISTYIGTIYDKQALAAGEATGRNEITGKDGGPIQVNNLTPDQIDARIAALLAKQE